MKKVVALILSVLLLLAVVAGCSPAPVANAAAEPTANQTAATQAPVQEEDTEAEMVKVAYLTFALSTEQWQLMSEGVKERGVALGYEVTVIDCAGNVSKQVEQIESCVEAGYEVLVVSPCEREALIEACKKAIEKGVRVVSLGDPGLPCQVYVAANEYDNAYGCGKKAAEWCNENWPEKETLNVCMLEWVYDVACVERAAGLLDGFKENAKATVEVVGSISPVDAAEANTMCESILQAYTVDVCLAIAGDQLYGFCLAAENAGIPYDASMGAAMDVTPVCTNALKDGRYIKFLGSWGHPSVEKADVHLKGVTAALEAPAELPAEPILIEYDVSYVDESTVDKLLADFGW